MKEDATEAASIARQQLHHELRDGKEREKQRAYDKPQPFGLASTYCNSGGEPPSPNHRGDNQGDDDDPKTNVAMHANTSVWI